MGHFRQHFGTDAKNDVMRYNNLELADLVNPKKWVNKLIKFSPPFRCPTKLSAYSQPALQDKQPAELPTETHRGHY